MAKRLKPGDVRGNLKAIEVVGRNKRGNAIWKLACVCGAFVERDSSSLSRKQIHSCGCIKKLVLSGKYGMLTPITPLETSSRGVVWQFQCDCGEKVNKLGAQVANLHGALHCGCVKRTPHTKHNLINARFGKLLVVERHSTNTSGRATWLCVCDCGNSVIVDGMYLKRGTRKHCGCDKKITRYYGYGDLSGTKWNKIKHGASKRGIAFDLTIEYTYNLFHNQNSKCSLSGKEISLSDGTASLDRINSSMGYIEGNVQWVHKHVNVMKWDFEQEYFLKLCKEIYEHTYEK